MLPPLLLAPEFFFQVQLAPLVVHEFSSEFALWRTSSFTEVAEEGFAASCGSAGVSSHSKAALGVGILPSSWQLPLPLGSFLFSHPVILDGLPPSPPITQHQEAP